MKQLKIKKKLLILFVLFLTLLNFQISSIKIIISIDSSDTKKKYWVGAKYKFQIKVMPDNNDENLYLKSLTNKFEIINNNFLLMKSSGKDCLIIYIKNIKQSFCISIFNTPEIKFNEKNIIKIETNSDKQLNLEMKEYPKEYIKYTSNHPEIIKVNQNGKIYALRPGNAIIEASGLDKKSTKIKVLSIIKKGLITFSMLDLYKAKQYNNLMIVAHPDDETLWGGANIFKERYFIVCLTNSNNYRRANDFNKILKFTNNSGFILNYPDFQDNRIDDWSEVGIGLFKDLSTLLNYKYWEKIVTHGPEGTTGHPHHKKISEYVTNITKKNNIYNNLFYFGKFYKKNNIPVNLKRISDEELEYKKKEVAIYESVKKKALRIWIHMLPYENWISASKWQL